jgi:hypothetical protein
MQRTLLKGDKQIELNSLQTYDIAHNYRTPQTVVWRFPQHSLKISNHCHILKVL